jgi:glycosyltransferase involved in cell wall biosynthesis
VVSAVITTYNRRHFLREAVLSVLEQDYGDKEILVVDDGSQDGSCEEIRDLPIRYEWKPNGGISSARNYGISLTRGDYIAFLDVDDLWKEKKLSRQVRAMEENQEAILCYTDEIWIRKGRRLNQKKRHQKYSGRIYEHCLGLCIISPSSALIRRKVFEDVGLFDESMPVCEDYDMWLRIASKYPVLFLPEPLIIKRGGHEDQLSTHYEGMDRFRIMSLGRMIESEQLTAEQRAFTLEELGKKCSVYAKGAEKRGRLQEAEYYRSLPERIGGLSVISHRSSV